MTTDHIGGSYPQGDPNTWMPDIWGYLVVKYETKMMIDIGCGYGQTCKWFADLGISIVGVDGDRKAIEQHVCTNVPASSQMVHHDFAAGPYIHGTPFDLAWCAELLEHVDERFLPNVQPCFESAKYAVITHAEPHQIGHHHVNCKPDSYWERVFHGWGFAHLIEETRLLRRTDRFRASWGRRTLMMFERI